MERIRMALALPGAIAACLAWACGPSSADDDTDTGTDTGTGIDTEGHDFDLAGPCAPEEYVGGFEVASRDTGTVQYAVVAGAIADSVNWNTTGAFVGEEGDCAVFEFSTWTCDPACEGGEICGNEGACVPAPMNLDFGTVVVTGLVSGVAMEPNASFNYQLQEIDNPPFVPGQRVLLWAEGAAGTEELLLDGVGVTPLEVPSPEIVLVDAEDMEVTWTPSDDAAGEVHGEFMIDQHGASKRWIFCSWEDDGAGVVPASLASLLCDDWTGLPSFATASLYRRTVDSVQTSHGCAELRVLSQTKLDLTFDCPQP